MHAAVGKAGGQRQGFNLPGLSEACRCHWSLLTPKIQRIGERRNAAALIIWTHTYCPLYQMSPYFLDIIVVVCRCYFLYG
jgi:hypothetical protein